MYVRQAYIIPRSVIKTNNLEISLGEPHRNLINGNTRVIHDR